MSVSIPHKKYYFHRKNGITLLIINRQISLLHFMKTKKKKSDNTFVHKQLKTTQEVPSPSKQCLPSYKYPIVNKLLAIVLWVGVHAYLTQCSTPNFKTRT